MVGGSLEFIFHKGVAAQLYQLGWRNKWPLHTWGCRLYTLSDKYKKTFYLQLRVCVSYLDVSSNEIFLASLGCLHINNSFHSYMNHIWLYLFFLFLQSLFFWNISHQGPALLKGIRVLLIAFWSSFTTALKLSLFYLSLLNPPVTFVIEPQQTAPPLTLGGNSEQH